MFWKKKKKFNLYQDEVEYVTSEEIGGEEASSDTESIEEDTTFEPESSYEENMFITGSDQKEAESVVEDDNAGNSFTGEYEEAGTSSVTDTEEYKETGTSSVTDTEGYKETGTFSVTDTDEYKETDTSSVTDTDEYREAGTFSVTDTEYEETDSFSAADPEEYAASYAEDTDMVSPEEDLTEKGRKKRRFSFAGLFKRKNKKNKEEAETPPENDPGEGEEAGSPTDTYTEGYGEAESPSDTYAEGYGEAGSPSDTDTEGYGEAGSLSYTDTEGYGEAGSPSDTYAEGYGEAESPSDTYAEGYGEAGSPSYTDTEGYGEGETQSDTYPEEDKEVDRLSDIYSEEYEDDGMSSVTDSGEDEVFYVEDTDTDSADEVPEEETGRKRRFSLGKKFKKKNKKKEEVIDKVNYLEPGYGLEEPKKKAPRKKIAVIVAVAVIFVGAAVFFVLHNLSGADEGKAYVESVADITGLGTANGMSNRYTGEVEPQDSWKVTLQSDLSVAECYVHVGDEVKEGDKLFSYNTEEIKLNKEKKELEVETLTNEMNQLKKDIAGYENDLKTANASEKIELQTQILTAQTTIKKDEFTIKSSKEEIENLEKNIKDATITSKMSGVVKSINTSLGSANSSDDDDVTEASSDDAYMTILALGDYRVKGKISEANVWMLNEGDPVIVRSRVDEKAKWTGTISQVKTDTNVTSNSTDNSDLDLEDAVGESASYYNFFVKLDDDTNLMMGQHVLIEVDYGQDGDREGIWLNEAYLHVEGDKYFVWLANSRDRLTLREVKVGEYNEDLGEYQILKGLSVSDYIAADADNLHENMRTTKNASEAGSTEYYDEEENDDEVYDDSDTGGISDSEMFETNDSGNLTENTNGGDNGLGADVLDDSQGSDQSDDVITIN